MNIIEFKNLLVTPFASTEAWYLRWQRVHPMIIRLWVRIPLECMRPNSKSNLCDITLGIGDHDIKQNHFLQANKLLNHLGFKTMLLLANFVFWSRLVTILLQFLFIQCTSFWHKKVTSVAEFLLVKETNHLNTRHSGLVAFFAFSDHVFDGISQKLVNCNWKNCFGCPTKQVKI